MTSKGDQNTALRKGKYLKATKTTKESQLPELKFHWDKFTIHQKYMATYVHSCTQFYYFYNSINHTGCAPKQWKRFLWFSTPKIAMSYKLVYNEAKPSTLCISTQVSWPSIKLTRSLCGNEAAWMLLTNIVWISLGIVQSH